MITAENKYFANLDILQNVNFPAYALLPTADKIYNINVNTRKIDNPNITLVEKDHKSATLYFAIDRYIDYMDLAHTKCLIQYNIGGNTYYYPVPYYDIYSMIAERKIILPWNLDYSVTATPGGVPFTIRFFKTGTVTGADNKTETILTYSLNILPSTIQIEKSLAEKQITNADEAYLKPGEVEKLMAYVDTTMKTLSRKVYWTVLSDEFTDDTIDVSGEIQDQLLGII